MKTALMFSGQGSQYPLMGLDLINLKHNQAKIKKAEEILNFKIREALENKNNELNQTKYTQPLITLVSMLLFDEYHKSNKIDGIIGFSLGEYSGLYAANIYSFTDLLKVVKYRSELMEEVVISNPGKMVAVLNYDLDKLEQIIKKVNNKDKIVTIANYNARNQLVISGNIVGVDLVIDELNKAGVKRLVPLNVSGAFHSALFEKQSVNLNLYLKRIKKNNNKYPVYLNTTANLLNINNLEEEMTKQMYTSIHFFQGIEKMISDGYETFIEIGPGKVLFNLVKKNYPSVKVYSVENLEQLKLLEENLNE